MRRGLTPFLFLLPGGAWLVVFFAVPMSWRCWVVSRSRRGLRDRYQLTWNFGIYAEVIRQSTGSCTSSALFALLTMTSPRWLIGYPWPTPSPSAGAD